MEWSQAETQGIVPSPHAGHAGATIGNNFILLVVEIIRMEHLKILQEVPVEQQSQGV
jgi:hypothetical protein